MNKKLLMLLPASLILVCCNMFEKKPARNIQRCFYYWKSSMALDSFEKNSLQNLDVNTLFVKFFDVAWNEKIQAAVPVAQIKMKDGNYLQHIKIIPVIFITNESIFKTDSLQINILAEKLFTLTNSICTLNHLAKVDEIQIDCDWTASTKEKYFALLMHLQQQNKRLIFSTTIRLHQIKFAEKTGVPPVTKGMLMCYNMGNLKNASSKNSIIDPGEFIKYTEHLNLYPLPLDVAFPIFSWKVLFRNNEYKGLLQDLPDELLTPAIFKRNGNIFTAKTDTLINGYHFKKNDWIRMEESNYEDIIKIAKIAGKKISNNNVRITLYHLDEVILKKYTKYELENIFDAMRR